MVLRATKTWDLRITEEVLSTVFSTTALPWYNPAHKGRIWYRCTKESAANLTTILAKVYEIPAPKEVDYIKGKPCFGRYYFKEQRIEIRRSGHIKTVLHEFYHHLDNMTNGRYNSDDRNGGDTSLAWQFAERYWEQLRIKRKELV